MPEIFTGKLEWITMGGNIDVRHPDGRLIRAYGVSPEHSDEANRLGKTAFVTVEIPDDIPGRGAFHPHVISIASPIASENVVGEEDAA